MSMDAYEAHLEGFAKAERQKIEVIQGWRVGAVYKSESGELLTVKDVANVNSGMALVCTITGDDNHSFDLAGTCHCHPRCRHGNLTNLVDTNTTTYKIRGKE